MLNKLTEYQKEVLCQAPRNWSGLNPNSWDDFLYLVRKKGGDKKCEALEFLKDNGFIKLPADSFRPTMTGQTRLQSNLVRTAKGEDALR